MKIIRIFSRRENLQNSSDPKFICPFKLNLRIKDDEVFDFRNTKIFSKESAKSNPKYTKYLHGWLIIKDHLHSNSDKSKQQMRKLNLECRSKFLIIQLPKLWNQNLCNSGNFRHSKKKKWNFVILDGFQMLMTKSLCYQDVKLVTNISHQHRTHEVSLVIFDSFAFVNSKNK